jgi:hypothetical protein
MTPLNKLKARHLHMTDLCAEQQRRITELEKKLEEIHTLLKLSLDITIKQV